MNISILLNSNEIVHRVLNYTRTIEICSGQGTLALTTDFETPLNVDPWDVIEIYEDGQKVGTYYVVDYGNSGATGNRTITAQDGSKRLVDFFIADSYTLAYPTMTRYWIEKFLTEAGVSYSINVATQGQVLSENSGLGPSSAYDLIMSLLQQSGWYMYFDADGVCQIGDLLKDLTNIDDTLTDDEILSLQIANSDKSLRNRAVVWGNYSGGSWAFADLTTKTGYETNENDIRPVVLANSTIYSSGTAATLAKKLLNEFSDITSEKTVELAGYYDINVGDVVYVDSKYYTGACLVTTVQVKADPRGGVTTTLIMDVKCPRLFAYYGFITWVYTGTDGQGVWRKRLDTALWEDFSTGLANLVVPDLIIRNGLFACITGDGCYINTSHYVANWRKFSPGTLVDSNGVSYTQDKLEAKKVAINGATNEISVLYSLTDSESALLGYQRSWIVITNGKRLVLRTYPIIITNTAEVDLLGIDVEKYAGKDLASVVSAGGAMDLSPESTWGKRQAKFFTSHDLDSVTITTPSTMATYSGVDVQYAGRFTDDTDGDLITNMVHGKTNYIFGLNELTQIVWSGDTKCQIDVPLIGITQPTGANALNNLTCYWLNEENRSGATRDYDDRLYYLLAMYGDGTNQNMTIKSFTPLLDGYPYEVADCVAVATSNITLATLQVIDGVTLVNNNRVLVTGQSNPTENGTYLAGMGAWTRTADTFSRCATVTVTGGTLYTNSVWQVEDMGTIVLDSDSITFKRVLLPGVVVNGLSIIDINTDWGYGISGNLSDAANLGIPPRMVDGVYYYFYRGKHFSTATSYMEKVNVYRYDCETGNTSNINIYAYPGQNYAEESAIAPTSRFTDEISMLCAGGAAYAGLQYFNATYDISIPDLPAYVIDGYVTAVIVKADRTTQSYFTDYLEDPHVYGTVHGTVFDDYLYYYSGLTAYYLRFQGARLINGLYYPYIKFTRSTTTYYDREAEMTAGFTAGVDLPQDIYLNQKDIRVYNVYSETVVDIVGPKEFQSWDGNDIIYEYEGDFENTESGDYEDNRGLFTTKLAYPVYLFNENTLRRGDKSKTDLVTLAAGDSNVISLSMDDCDSSVYRYFTSPEKMVVKESINNGATLDTFLISTAIASPILTVSQGQIYLGSFASPTNDVDVYDLDIYKLSNNILSCITDGSAYLLERNQLNTFDIIDTDDYKLNIESSINWPLISRTTGEILNTNSTEHHFRIYSTYPNRVEGSGLMLDARASNIGGNFLGVQTEIPQAKYGLVVPSGGSLYLASTTDANNKTPLYTYSGAIVLETSNNYIPQYIFIASQSGFMQRFPIDNSAFVDHSSGMPASEILIIRLDDRV